MLDIEWPAVNSRSVVLASVAEWPAGDHIVGDDQPRWVGDANIWIAGIAPRDGGVRIAVNIDWPNPMPFVTDLVQIAPGAGQPEFR